MIFDQLDWQTCVALLIVVGAIGILARNMWKSLLGAATSGCGTSCESCPASKPASSNSLKVTKLVQLDSTPEESETP